MPQSRLPMPPQTAPCLVCGTPSGNSRPATVLGRHTAHYYLCATCEFVWIHEPYWLEEAYEAAIAALDTGVLVRNERVGRQLAALLGRVFQPSARFLDVGAGHGYLVRRMRDRGFDFRWSDMHAEPLVARGFEDDGGRYEAVCAIEVLEHTTEPVDFLLAALDRAENAVVFTTELYTDAKDLSGFPRSDWWYLAHESGQHLSFFSPVTLEHIAAQLGCHLVSYGQLHMLSRHPLLTPRQFRRTIKRPYADLWAALAHIRRPSRTWTDFEHVKRRGSGG
jgi:hypothetical protein